MVDVADVHQTGTVDVGVDGAAIAHQTACASCEDGAKKMRVAAPNAATFPESRWCRHASLLSCGCSQWLGLGPICFSASTTTFFWTLGGQMGIENRWSTFDGPRGAAFTFFCHHLSASLSDMAWDGPTRLAPVLPRCPMIACSSFLHFGYFFSPRSSLKPATHQDPNPLRAFA